MRKNVRYFTPLLAVAAAITFAPLASAQPAPGPEPIDCSNQQVATPSCAGGHKVVPTIDEGDPSVCSNHQVASPECFGDRPIVPTANDQRDRDICANQQVANPGCIGNRPISTFGP